MTNRFRSHAGEVSGNSTRRILIVGIIGITLLGLYLRFRCLGCLGFRWDEDLTSLAVKALLEKGVPELPSGMIYLRFYPYQWLVAASVKVFGFSEFSMRLPAVILGTLLIPASYWVSKRLFDARVGLVVAACIALSFWQVEMARTARMYAPFFLVYIFAAYAIFRAHYENLDRAFSPWVLPLALLALSIHQLAYSLAIILLLAIPLRKSAVRSASLILQAGVIGIAFIVFKSLQDRYFNIARGAVKHDDGGPLAGLLQQFSLPDPGLFSQTFSAFPVATIASLGIALLATIWVSRFTRGRGNPYRILAVIAIGLSILHQFNLVAGVLVLMLIALQGGIREIRNPAWYAPALVCASLFLLWSLVVTVISMSAQPEVAMASQGTRKLLRTLVDYPNFRLFWSYALERPLLAVPLALGTLWGIDKIARDKPDATALFVLGSFWSVLFVNGVLQTKFEFFRYNLQLDPLFLILIVVGMFAIPGLLEQLGTSFASRFRPLATTKTGFVVVALVAIAGVNPVAAFLTSARDYKETAFPYTSLGLDSYVDFKNPAAYVRGRLRDNDIVLVLDPREYWNYIGRVDYWLWSDDDQSQTYMHQGRPHDLYLGIPVLSNSTELEAILAARGVGSAWILYSKERLARTKFISPDLRSYLSALDDRIVYTGRDGQMVVVEITD